MQPFTIIITGPPGSGKGTQAKLLEQFLRKRDPKRRSVSFSTGEGFRAVVQKQSYSSQLMREILDQGGLLPEFLAIWLWTGIFMEKLEGNEHIITDGFPRRPLEGQVLDSAFVFYRRTMPYILNLRLTEEQAVERLGARKMKEGRADDRVTALGERFKLYREQTLPTIEMFRGNPRYRFHDIDGAQSVEKVHHDILH